MDPRYQPLDWGSWDLAVCKKQPFWHTHLGRKAYKDTTAFYGTPPPDEERLEFLDRAYELGCTHWDSAAMYGDNETLLGKWFERTSKRSEVS
jgi:aryl-alcohol dehydrogenase-like predicted oxidoreductase